MIEKQGVAKYPESVTKDHIYETVNRLGCVQIDTINVVERAHYLTLWSRLGCYNKDLLHQLAYNDRRLFEHWAHAASYIPFKDYQFYLQSMEDRKQNMYNRFKKRTKADPTLIDQVLKRIVNEGPLSSRDFEGSKKKGGWWNWKPAKLALEILLGAGILLVHHRENFQKYYDLSENIIPSGVDTSKPSDEERIKFFSLKTLSCLGLVKAQEIRKYYQNWSIKLSQTSKQLENLMNELESEGQVVKDRIEGDRNFYYCLPSDFERIEELDTGNFDFNGVRLFVYFDNLLWIRERVEQLFGFKPKLEVYVPRELRIYGYYHLPVLYGDRLVARLEPKMDRKNHCMIVRGYWIEEGFIPDEDYEEKLLENLGSFATFHNAETIDWKVNMKAA